MESARFKANIIFIKSIINLIWSVEQLSTFWVHVEIFINGKQLVQYSNLLPKTYEYKIWTQSGTFIAYFTCMLGELGCYILTIMPSTSFACSSWLHLIPQLGLSADFFTLGLLPDPAPSLLTTQLYFVLSRKIWMWIVVVRLGAH